MNYANRDVMSVLDLI